MKKFAYLFTALCMMFTFACGDDDTAPVEPAPEQPQAPYTISADRTELLVGESVTFSVTSSDGVDISDQCTYCSDAACYAGRTIRMDVPGTFIFEAHYLNNDPAYPDGVPTANKLEIVVKEAVTYTVSANKTTVRTGKGVILSMHSSDGKDVTKKSTFFVDGVELGVSRFTTEEEPRSYVVTAVYMGDESHPEGIEAANELIIKAINDEEVFTLYPTKTQCFVGESITFSVWNNYEDNLTKAFSILDPDGNVIASPFYYRFTAAGDYTFSAMRGEDKCEDVTVSVKERGEIDPTRFYRRSLMGDLTATWCMQCPSMVKMINYLEENLIDDRLVIVGIHAGAGTIPSEMGDMGEAFMTLLMDFQSVIWNSIPAYTIDFNLNYTSNSWSAHPDDIDTGAPLIERMISGSQSEDMGVPGIAAASTLNGHTLDLDIRVTAQDADSYYIGVALVEDNIVGYQTGAPENFTHRHVGQGMITDRNEIAVPIGYIGAGEEKSLSYTYEIPTTLHSRELNLDNCSVAIWVCRKNSDQSVAPLGYTCVNTISLPVGESVDYQYESKF